MKRSRWRTLTVLSVLHVIVPVYGIGWVALTPNISQWDWIGKIAITGLYLILLHLAGYWAYISYYVRYIWPVLFAGAVGFSFTEVKRLPFFVEKGTGTWVMGGLVIALLIYWIRLALRSRQFDGEPVRLAFPLAGGTYAVMEGGNGERGGIVNNHCGSSFQQGSQANISMKYAVDIIKLHDVGTAVRGILPRRLEAYAIFRETLLSPCDGKVVKVIDRWPDEIPFGGDHPYHIGNLVVIRHQDIHILMGHLQQGSILVEEGAEIHRGQPLARIGNSGWSQWPHLHIQAMKATPDVWDGEGVPILFDGTFPVRNDLFRR